MERRRYTIEHDVAHDIIEEYAQLMDDEFSDPDFSSRHTKNKMDDEMDDEMDELLLPPDPLVSYHHPELEKITRQCPSSLHHHHHHSLDVFSLGLHLARYFHHDYGERFVDHWGPLHVVMCMDLMVWNYGQEPLRNSSLVNPAAMLTAKVRESRASIRRQHEAASAIVEQAHGQLACLCQLCFDQGLGAAQSLPRAEAGGASDKPAPANRRVLPEQGARKRPPSERS